jgi:hypothetical protein
MKFVIFSAILQHDKVSSRNINNVFLSLKKKDAGP